MVNFKSLEGEIDFYFVRHGKSTGNKKNIIQGHLDFPLSEEGKLQAKRAGKWFSDKRIDMILTSPLSRAKSTAELIAESTGGVEVETEELLKELDTGVFSGFVFDDIPRTHPEEWASFQEKSWEGVTNAEKPDEIYNRAVELWNKLFILASRGYRSILAVSHAGMIQWIIKATFGHREWLPLFPMSNGGIFQFSVRNRLPARDGKLRGVNNPGTSYMYRWALINFRP